MTENRHADRAAKLYGLIYCYGPNGEEIVARTTREAAELTGVSKSSVSYALNEHRLSRGWKFERIKEENPNDWSRA